MDETDDSYSDDSFVLCQVRAKINLSKNKTKPKEDTSDSQPAIQTIAIPISSQVFESSVRHMCRCKHYAQKCVSDDVQ